MKLAECKELKSGAEVKWCIGNGCYQHGRFKRLVKVTSLGSMTFSDLMNGKPIDMSKGKERLDAMVEYTDDNGRTRTTYIGTRKLKRE